MAAAAVQHIPSTESWTAGINVGGRTQAPLKVVSGNNDSANPQEVPKHDVAAELNYFKANEDGSPPHPTYVDRPETYERPVETHKVTVHDVAGREDEFSLDDNGFQVHRHTATEKDFLDDEQIKQSYYPETEQLLKDV